MLLLKCRMKYNSKMHALANPVRVPSLHNVFVQASGCLRLAFQLQNCLKVLAICCLQVLRKSLWRFACRHLVAGTLGQLRQRGEPHPKRSRSTSANPIVLPRRTWACFLRPKGEAEDLLMDSTCSFMQSSR